MRLEPVALPLYGAAVLLVSACDPATIDALDAQIDGEISQLGGEWQMESTLERFDLPGVPQADTDRARQQVVSKLANGLKCQHTLREDDHPEYQDVVKLDLPLSCHYISVEPFGEPIDREGRCLHGTSGVELKVTGVAEPKSVDLLIEVHDTKSGREFAIRRRGEWVSDTCSGVPE